MHKNSNLWTIRGNRGTFVKVGNRKCEAGTRLEVRTGHPACHFRPVFVPQPGKLPAFPRVRPKSKNINCPAFRSLAIAIFTMFIFSTCNDQALEGLDFVTAVTVDTEVVDIDKVRLFGRIDGIDGAINPADYPNREYGFLVTGSLDEPTLGAAGVEKVSFGSDFVSNIDYDTLILGLSLRKVFFFRSFIQIGERISYGNTLPFTLSQNLAVGLSDSVKVVNDGAELRGVLVLRFQENINDHGFVLSASNTLPTIEDNDFIFPLGQTNDDGEFRVLADSLEFNTCYYVRAYAQVNNEHIYHDDSASVSFATRDGWKRVALLADQPFSDPMGGVIDETAYFGMGCDGFVCNYPTQTSTFTQVWRLDLSADTLVNIGLPGASGRRGGVSFTLGNKIYYGLGYFDDAGPIAFPVYQNDLWAFGADSGWEELTMDSFPGPLRQDAVAVSLNGKAYIGTGSRRDLNFGDRVWYDDFWVFDPAEAPGHRWRRLEARLPFRDGSSGQDLERGRTEAIAFALGNRLYAGCGEGLGNDRKDLWSLGPENEEEWRWEASGDFLGRRRAVAFSLNDKAYVGMGQNKEGEPLFSLWELTSDGSWKEVEPFPVPETIRDKVIPQAAVSLNGKAYIAGPNVDFISFDVWEYTPFDGSGCK